jgi:tRNA (cytidine32/uridine32-2'-O)-methyltransferase
VGGALRSVVNHGLAGLRIVGSGPFDEEDVFAYSSGAVAFGALDYFTELNEAIADCDVVVGTSRRSRDPDAPPQWPAAGLAQRLAGSRRVGLLFGTERTGLTTDELARCSAVVWVPTSDQFPSMNLAHAVACLGYELARPEPTSVGPAPSPQEPARLEGAKREAFFAHVERMVGSIGYPPGRSPEAFVRRLRKILYRANLSQQELSLLGGVFSELGRLGGLAGVSADPLPEERGPGSGADQ